MLRALDTETALITEFDKAPVLTCVALSPHDKLYRWDQAKEHVATALSHHTIVGVNIAFDMAVICRAYEDLIPLVWEAYAADRIRDVAIEAKLMDIAVGNRTERSYSLATLVKEHFDVELDKTTYRFGYGQLRDVPVEQWPDGAVKYALDDARWTLRLLERIDGGPDKYRQARHAFWAYLMGVWGIQTDPVRVAALRQSLEARRTKALDVLVSGGIIRPDGTQDTKATRARMAACGGRRMTEPSAKFPDGQLKIDEECCRDSGDPVLEVVADYGSIRKQLTTDIPNLERGEIHTRYDSLKDTGRMGSGGKDNTSPTGTAFNLTNLARSGGIRECFVPRAGKVYFDADYAALEAYTGAQACLWLIGESSLRELLVKGEDYHIHTSAAYLGCTYEDAMRRYKAGDTETKVLRQFSKIFNYGLGGGMGKNTAHAHAQKELKKAGHRELAKSLTREQSDKLWEVWRMRYPEWPKYFARNGRVLGDHGCVIEQLVSERKRGIFGSNAYSTLNNGYFQSLGADAAKDAGWRIAWECYDPTRNSVLFGSRLVCFGHDSFTGECDPEGGHEVAMRVGELMAAVSDIWTPDAPLRTEPGLATCMSKEATAIYEKGRLVPWTPKAAVL
jgi:3'-5' exonuclease